MADSFEKKWGKITQQMVQAPRQNLFELYGPKPPPPTRGRGGPLSAFISEAGGAGGALAGGAAGTAILPGVGTILGAILGGFGGGTAGRGIENKFRDDQKFFGEGGSAESAFKEGALSGALSGAGAGFQAFKGARAAKALGAVSGGADDVVKTAVSATPKIGLLQKKGLGLTSKSAGYHIGAPSPGTRGLTLSKVKEYDDLLRNLKIGANDAADISGAVESKLLQTGNILKDTIAKNNAILSPKTMRSFADDLVKQVNSKGGLNKTATKYAQEQAEKLAKIKDTKGLLNFKRELDSAINYGKNPSAAVSQQQGALSVFRNAAKERLNSLVPGLKQQNNLYHSLSEIQEYALKAANRGATQATSAGGGLFGRALSSPTANTLKSKAGSRLQSLGTYTAGTGGPATQFTQQLKLQAPGNIAQALMGGGAPVDQTMQMPGQPAQFGGAPVGGIPDQLGGLQSPGATMQQPAMTIQQAFQQAVQELGPGVTVPQYMAYAKELMSQGGEAGPNITKVTGQQYGLAQTGLTALQQLTGLLQSDPGVLNRSATPGRKLPVVGGFISNAADTGEFDAYGYNIADTLLRLRTGAQANESEVKNLQSQIMPRAGDSPQTVQTKLQQLQQAFNQIISQAGQSGATNPMEEALTGYGQPQQYGY